MRGINNIVYLPKVREKIMSKVIKRGVSEQTGYGIGIKLENGIYLKSFSEFIVYTFLKDKGIDFEYETVKIPYKYGQNYHTYFADFIVNKCIYELKSYPIVRILEKSFEDANKYEVIKESAKKLGYDFKIVNPTMLFEEFGSKYRVTKKSLEEKKDILFKYLKENKISWINVNKGISKIKIFLETEDRWKQFNNINVNHKE